MCELCKAEHQGIPRRDFIKTMGVSLAGVSLGAGRLLNYDQVGINRTEKKPASIHCAFLYPPSTTLEAEGYYSWPGSDFEAEKRQARYVEQIREMEGRLGIRVGMDQKPLDNVADVDLFIAEIKAVKPDGLLLIPFKKSHYDHVVRIVEETNIPTVVLASLGILLMEHIMQLRDRPGVYLINSLDDLDAVESGLNMIKTRCWLRDAVIVSIEGNEVVESIVPVLGTRIRTMPHQKFYDLFAGQKADDGVIKLAKQYSGNALRIVQPTEEDIVEAAKSYFVFKRILAEEKADALMMDCLPGLRKPHKHVPPCMGFMSMQDECIPMGCQADLNATLTMMLMKGITGRPGFMHNVSFDTEKNLYFCAHCTSPSRMNGPGMPAETYELMSHCESGWGTVPRVLFREGQEVTITKYEIGETKPRLYLYSGNIVKCPSIPPTGGCRTNVETTLNELERGSDLKGRGHMVMYYGHYVKQLRQFCQLYDLEVVV